FLLLLACQPILWNLANLFAAALQSVHVLAPVAIIRGLVIPLGQAAVLLVAWQLELSVVSTLLSLVAISVVAVLCLGVLYARHFSLSRTIASAFAPRYTRETLSFGFALIAPVVLFTA